MITKSVGTVWIVKRNTKYDQGIWAVGDDEYSAKKIVENSMRPEEFKMFPMEITHVEVERK